MAFLTPDRTYTEHGLEIKEKLITATSGVRYYSNKLLTTADHKPAWITVHNTADIDEAPGTNDAEQYARATYNNNMGDVVVHYYIDETDCWHILADDTVGYHAASVEGNYTSVAIEIIMDGSGKPYDVQAEERGALLAAILLTKYDLGMDRLTTHNRWYSAKYCPTYILPHWNQFYAKVKAYYDQIQSGKTVEVPSYTASDSVRRNKNYLTYPTRFMYISQNYSDGYSHKPHSQGSPADYPIDDRCSDGGRDWFYCPCDEMQVAHIRGVGEDGTNAIWLESTTPVVMPYGEDYITLHVVHPNDDTLSGIKKGQVFRRGDKMFLEGDDGNATGWHFHMAVGTGKFIGNGWVLNSKNAWVNKTTGIQLKPEAAFFIDPEFTTVLNSDSIAFKTLPTEDEKTENTPDVKETGIGNGTVYRVQIGSYANKAGAEALAALAKAKGFDVAVVPFLRGDVDGDGEVTAADARAALRIATGLEE